MSSYEGDERRQPENAKLRCELDQIQQGTSLILQISKNDIALLFDLVREICQQDGNRSSPKVFRKIRNERADELTPALIELIDDLLS